MIHVYIAGCRGVPMGYGGYERQRLYVTPGLTCFWQIQPNRNDLSFAEWMDLDLKYVQERSFTTETW